MKKLLVLVAVGILLLGLGCGNGEDNGANGDKGQNGPSGFAQMYTDTEEGITSTTYMGTGTAGEALEVFESWAHDRGWEDYEAVPGDLYLPVEDIHDISFGMATFTKGDQLLVVVAYVIEGQTFAVVLVGPYDNFYNGNGNGNDLLPPPTQDLTGEDIEGVPRYPGAFRVESGEKWDIVDVQYAVYVTEDDISTVVQWYADNLADHGWSNVDVKDGGYEITATIVHRVLMLECSVSDRFMGVNEIYVQSN